MTSTHSRASGKRIESAALLNVRRFSTLACTAMACLALASFGSRGWCQGASEVIVVDDTASPDNNGLFSFFGPPVLNNNGQAVFWSLMDGTNNGFDDDMGVFRASTTPGDLTLIAREMQPAPDNNGTFGDFELRGTAAAINDSGQVAFRTNVANTAGGNNDDGIFHGAAGTVTQIARNDQPAPGGGTFSSFEVPFLFRGGVGVSGSGKVTFFGSDNSGGEYIYQGSGGAVAQITNQIETFWALHPSGQAAYRANGANEIFQASGGAQIQIVELNQAAPDNNGVYGDLLDVAVNGSGQVAFASFMNNTAGGATDDKGMFRGSGASIAQIMRSGQPAPLGVGVIDDFDGSQPAINASGQVAFGVRLRNSAAAADDDTAIMRGAGGPLTQIVREGQLAPDGNGRFSDFSFFPSRETFGYHSPAINDLGWVAFGADLRDSTAAPNDDSGLFVGDGIDVVQVSRKGANINGGVINALAFVSIPNEGRSGFNNSGQVAYRAQTNSGGDIETFIMLWTPPDTEWAGGSGTWSDSNHWAQGVTPKSLFHTTLNPAGGATIIGDFNSEHLRSLTIGGGNDTVTLNLQSGSILSLVDGLLLVADNGALTGSGVVDGTLANSPAGEIIAGSGQQLVFTGVGNDNQGSITLTGGRVHFRQDFTKNGLVIGNGTLRADAGVSNNADMAFSATTNVVGDVTNDVGGTIISAGGNSTFFDDVTNNGEIRTSQNSATVYFGSYAGNGDTGTGTVLMEGDLKPGSSPGTMAFGGNLSFGPAAGLEIEIGGLLAGSQYDQVTVADSASLSGTLELSLIDGFAPTAGDMFEIVTATNVVDTFDVENLPDLGGLNWNVNYGTTNVVLEVVSPFSADFDNDGDVDAGDLTQWVRDFGGPNSDADRDGDSDGADFLAWQRQFGRGGSAPVASQAVPEPSTVVLLGGFAAVGMLGRRSRHGCLT